jgi:hypothetical protein
MEEFRWLPDAYQRVNALLDTVPAQISLLSLQTHGRYGYVAKGDVILAVDELFLLLTGLDTEGMIQFSTQLFAEFDNNSPAMSLVPSYSSRTPATLRALCSSPCRASK